MENLLGSKVIPLQEPTSLTEIYDPNGEYRSDAFGVDKAFWEKIDNAFGDTWKTQKPGTSVDECTFVLDVLDRIPECKSVNEVAAAMFAIANNFTKLRILNDSERMLGPIGAMMMSKVIMK